MPKNWRTLFHFEAPEDGGGEAEVEANADLDGIDLEAIDDAALEPTPVEEAQAAAWALDQNDWETTVNYLQQTAPILQQLQAALPYLQNLQGQQGPPPAQPYFGGQQQPQQQVEIDPFDPNSVTAFIQQQVGYGVQQALEQYMAPYSPILDSVASEQGASLAKAELENIRGQVGDFDQDTAFMIAAGSIEQGMDPAQSLRQAAQYTKDFESRVRADEREKFKEELKNLRGAPNETPAGGASATEIQSVPTGPRRYHEVVERVLARQNSTPMVG